MKKLLLSSPLLLLATICFPLLLAACGAPQSPVIKINSSFPHEQRRYYYLDMSQYPDIAEYLVDSEIIAPYAERIFRPFQAITQGELVTAIFRSKYSIQELENNACFRDNRHEWNRNLCFLEQNFPNLGTKIKSINPEATISFREAADWIYRLDQASDCDQCDNINKEAVEFLDKNNAIPEEIFLFNLDFPVNRLTIADVLYRLQRKILTQNSLIPYWDDQEQQYYATYFTRQNNKYYYGAHEETVMNQNTIGIDGELTILSPSFALYRKKDAENYQVYYHEQVLPEITSINDFRILGNKKDSLYATLNGKIIFQDQFLTEADANSFKGVLGNLAQDKKHIYLAEKTVPAIDTKSFEVLDRYYYRDKNGVYYLDHDLNFNGYEYYLRKLESVSVNSFNVMKNAYAKDQKAVYYRGKQLKDADSNTFEILDEQIPGYTKDQSHVYFQDKIVQDADVKTFKIIKNGLAYLGKDQNHVFENEQTLQVDAPIFDAASFELLYNANSLTPKFSRDQYQIYFKEAHVLFVPEINGTPLKDFFIINSTLFHDGENVYQIRGKELIKYPDANLQNIILLNDEFYYNGSHVYFVNEDNSVTIQETAIDFNSLGFLGDSKNPNAHYVKDKLSVYYDGQPMAQADMASFNLFVKTGEISYSELAYYAKDDQHVYYKGAVVEGDPKSYEFKGGFTRDQDNVYINGKKILGADPATFRPIELEGFSSDSFRDDYHVFGLKGTETVLLTDVDPNSFVLLKWGYAKDARAVYSNNEKIIGADPDSFVPLNFSYAIDKSHVYRDGEILEDADPATFTVSE